MYGGEWNDWPVLGFCFAYDSIKLTTLIDRLSKLDDRDNPPHNVDTICSLSKGCILNGVPLLDRDGRHREHPHGGMAYEAIGSTPAPGTVRFAQRVPQGDEGAAALRTFYTTAFGSVVRGRIAPINMFAYQQFEYKSAR